MFEKNRIVIKHLSDEDVTIDPVLYNTASRGFISYFISMYLFSRIDHWSVVLIILLPGLVFYSSFYRLTQFELFLLLVHFAQVKNKTETFGQECT